MRTLEESAIDNWRYTIFDLWRKLNSVSIEACLSKTELIEQKQTCYRILIIANLKLQIVYRK